jgi:hypothetical protein
LQSPIPILIFLAANVVAFGVSFTMPDDRESTEDQLIGLGEDLLGIEVEKDDLTKGKLGLKDK